MNKRILTMGMAAILCAASEASAIDFSVKGLWQYGFSYGDNSLVKSVNNKKANTKDTFHARSRIRLQLDARASEKLSGTVFFEMGNMGWGEYGAGAALGADGTIVKLRQAYLDWMAPNASLKLRMGIQNINLPKRAGGGLVMDNADTAGITFNQPFSEQVGLTGFWLRPFNDNYEGQHEDGTKQNANYLDNIDLFGLTLPLRFDGIELTPWIMYGIRGKNTFALNRNGNPRTIWNDGNPNYTLSSNPFGGRDLVGSTGKLYGNMFWAGLPVSVTALEPWNIEFDANYGYVESLGRYDATVRGAHMERASTRREGWLVKALVEYQMDWGTPGIFGWYGTGDDGLLSNGSERIPSIDPWAKFTSYTGSAGPYPTGYNDLSSNYAGTWGIGLHLKDINFLKDLKHVVRVAFMEGTNSTSMVKYANARDDWHFGKPNKAGLYMTTADSLIEFNFDSYYKMCENLMLGLETGYIINNFDHDTWQKESRTYLGENMSMQDAWHATLYMEYRF